MIEFLLRTTFVASTVLAANWGQATCYRKRGQQDQGPTATETRRQTGGKRRAGKKGGNGPSQIKTKLQKLNSFEAENCFDTLLQTANVG